MITAGVDVGAKMVKVVIMKDGKVLSRSSTLSGNDDRNAAEFILNEAGMNGGIAL